VPWRQNDFNGAIKRIAGQDIRQIAPLTDILSPMTYAKMTGNKPEWISSIVKDIASAADNKTLVVPAIAAEPMYNTGNISDAEFEQYIINAMAAPSAGITFWPWESLTANQKKIIKKYIPER
jgi:hypothetical protein